MNRVCDAGGICPHKPQCEHFCHFTNAEVEPDVVRKIKAYPAVPDDIEPMPEVWHKIGAFMLGSILAMIVVAFALVFFTGIWIWSLLI
jgi:hypothetical protein